MAPEVINHERYSRPADVFSFAMVLFELVTHEYPFADRSPVMAAKAIAIDQLRPQLPDGTPPALAGLIASCWDASPARRPQFADVAALETFSRDILQQMRDRDILIGTSLSRL